MLWEHPQFKLGLERGFVIMVRSTATRCLCHLPPLLFLRFFSHTGKCHTIKNSQNKTKSPSEKKNETAVPRLLFRLAATEMLSAGLRRQGSLSSAARPNKDAQWETEDKQPFETKMPG